MFKVNEAEAFGYSQVDDNILKLAFNGHTALLHTDGAYHRFLRNRSGRNLYQRIRSHASRKYGPRQLALGYPRYILTTI